MIQKFKLEIRFSAAHFYHQPKWSEEKNREIFGRCFTRYGHGHNYFLVATFKGSEIQKTQGLLRDIVNKVDHEHLNFEIPEFKNKIPTTEVICEYFVDKIQAQIHAELIELTLFEDHDIGAIWERDSQ